MTPRAAQTAANALEVLLALGLTVAVIRELERSEKRELMRQATDLARQHAGTSVESWLSRIADQWRSAVEGWAERKSQRKQQSKAMRELKKLTWEAKR